jgi:hypothetical protein
MELPELKRSKEFKFAPAEIEYLREEYSELEVYYDVQQEKYDKAIESLKLELSLSTGHYQKRRLRKVLKELGELK